MRTLEPTEATPGPSWHAGWPTTPGAYWFRGRGKRALERGCPPLTLLACVRNNGGLLETHLLSPAGSTPMDPENYSGLWQRIPEPGVPGEVEDQAGDAPPVLEWIPYRSQDQGYIRQEIASHTWTQDDERMVFVARLDQSRDGSLDGIWFLHQGSAEISSDFIPYRSREEGKADLLSRLGLLLAALGPEVQS